MQDLEMALAALLNIASSVSDQFAILSIREPGWVEACVRMHLPQLKRSDHTGCVTGSRTF